MKALILAVAMTAAAAAQAWTVDYGPGAYTKSVIVCDTNKGGNQVNCGPRLYKFYAPRYETVDITNGHGNVIGSYKRLTTGNWGTVKFANKADERKYAECQRGQEKGYSFPGCQP